MIARTAVILGHKSGIQKGHVVNDGSQGNRSGSPLNEADGKVASWAIPPPDDPAISATSCLNPSRFGRRDDLVDLEA